MEPIARVEHPLLDQVQVYLDMRQELERDFPGRWVVIHRGQLHGTYDSFEEAEEARRDMGIKINECLIKNVRRNPITIQGATNK